MFNLLSGKAPADYMNDQHRLEIKKKHVGGSKELRRLLYDMTEPDLEKRIGSVKSVRKRLKKIGKELVPVNKTGFLDKLNNYEPPKHGLRSVLENAILSTLIFSTFPYAIPSVVQPFAEKEDDFTLSENIGLSIGFTVAVVGVVSQIFLYSIFPELLALPLATNLANGVYEINEYRKRKRLEVVE